MNARVLLSVLVFLHGVAAAEDRISERNQQVRERYEQVLARTMRHYQDHEEAIRAFRHALRLNPDEPKYCQRLNSTSSSPNCWKYLWN